MLLSNIKEKFDFVLVKNNEFDSLGMTNHSHKSKLLVYLNRMEFLDELLDNPNISCAICTPELVDQLNKKKIYGIAVAKNPKNTFYSIHNFLAETSDFYYKKTPTKIHPKARVHKNSQVANFNVEVGESTIIEPYAIIHPNSYIGRHSLIQTGCVIGGEGFEYIRTPKKVIPVLHAGSVKIGDFVEIKNNTTIDKNIFHNTTLIGSHTKINKQVFIGHGVQVGQRCLIGTNSVLTGSSQLGDDVWVGPSVTVRNRVKVGNSARLNIGSVVTMDVDDEEIVSGNFAIAHKTFIEFMKWKKKFNPD